jgi:hypothetical protein
VSTVIEKLKNPALTAPTTHGHKADSNNDNTLGRKKCKFTTVAMAILCGLRGRQVAF